MPDQIVLLHISDLHMVADMFNESFRGIPGRTGHSALMANALPEAIRAARKACQMEPAEPLYLVMTGDLTALGKAAEFATGHKFLSSTTPNPDAPPGIRGQSLGLAFPAPRIFSIPGNHDHWDNAKVLGLLSFGANNPAIFSRKAEPPAPFHFTPWKSEIVSSGKGFQLDLFGIDTNSGLREGETNKRALGSIADLEFYILDALLNRRSKDTRPSVRAILAHHTTQPSRKLSTVFPFPLNDRSKRALVALMGRYRVTALLTGHMHEVHTVRHESTVPGSFSTREFRCGTTLQGPPMAGGDHGFLVHQIKRDPKTRRITWATRLFGWNGAPGYYHADDLEPDFLAPVLT